MGLGFVGETRGEFGRINYFDAGAFVKAIGEPADAGVQAEIVQDGGAQELGKFADAVNGILHQLDAIVDAGAVGGVLRQGEQVGFDRRQRASQLVVQFVREAAGG